MLLSKEGPYPDYIVARDPIYVECKQGRESWEIDDFTWTQLELLDEHTKRGGLACLFLLMSGEDASITKGGREAWLVEWEAWRLIQKEIKASGFLSIRFVKSARSHVPIAKDILSIWELEWKPGQGWQIPREHPLYIRFAPVIKGVWHVGQSTDNSSRDWE
jgi:hypothetical protein